MGLELSEDCSEERIITAFYEELVDMYNLQFEIEANQCYVNTNEQFKRVLEENRKYEIEFFMKEGIEENLHESIKKIVLEEYIRKMRCLPMYGTHIVVTNPINGEDVEVVISYVYPPTIKMVDYECVFSFDIDFELVTDEDDDED